MLIVIVAFALGWMLSYLRLPYLDWRGVEVLLVVFGGSLAVFIFGIALRFSSVFPKGSFKALWLTGLALVLLSGAALVAKLSERFELKALKVNETKQLNQIYRNTIDSLQHHSAAALIESAIQRAEAYTVKGEPLPERLILHIADLAGKLTPYKYTPRDSLKPVFLSPGRALLLLGVVRAVTDTASIKKILETSTFAYADVRKANLSGMDLSKADLRHANFQNSNLDSTCFNEANLFGANFWGASIVGASFQHARLRWATLSWVNCSGCIFKGSKMSNIRALSANFAEADFSRSHLELANLSFASFSRAELFDTSLKGAEAVAVDFSESKIMRPILRQTDLTNSIFLPEVFDSALVERHDWFEHLKTQHPEGTEWVLKNYTLVDVKGASKRFLIVKK
ncbi:MAG: hypothetical protein Kow0075_06670 [Salibacteraceae bacterium]